jgi:hypothetical protein
MLILYYTIASFFSEVEDGSAFGPLAYIRLMRGDAEYGKGWSQPKMWARALKCHLGVLEFPGRELPYD